MPPDDDEPGRPSRGYIHDGDGTVPVSDEPQAAHWHTLESSLPGEAVRECIRRALAPRQPFAYGSVLSGTEGPRGFIFTFRVGSAVLVGEVGLAAWDGGTQVHVALPRERKRKDVQVLVDWLSRVLKDGAKGL